MRDRKTVKRILGTEEELSGRKRHRSCSSSTLEIENEGALSLLSSSSSSPSSSFSSSSAHPPHLPPPPPPPAAEEDENSVSAIKCRLETKELWDKFDELGTEMIIT